MQPQRQILSHAQSERYAAVRREHILKLLRTSLSRDLFILPNVEDIEKNGEKNARYNFLLSVRRKCLEKNGLKEDVILLIHNFAGTHLIIHNITRSTSQIDLSLQESIKRLLHGALENIVTKYFKEQRDHGDLLEKMRRLCMRAESLKRRDWLSDSESFSYPAETLGLFVGRNARALKSVFCNSIKEKMERDWPDYTFEVSDYIRTWEVKVVVSSNDPDRKEKLQPFRRSKHFSNQ